jgi:hypothetical protein
MKTLYTGHVRIGKQYVYSFIYAETLLEAERHLTELLQRYVCEQYHVPKTTSELPIRIVSRPNGWNPPDGFYLPATSKQYALKYSPGEHVEILNEGSIHEETSHIQIDTGSVKAFKPFMIQPG